MVTPAEDSELLVISFETGTLGCSGNSKSSDSEKLSMSLSISFTILFGVFFTFSVYIGPFDFVSIDPFDFVNMESLTCFG